MERTCKQCGEDKPIEEFRRSTKVNNVKRYICVSSICNVCENQRRHNYYASNKGKIKVRELTIRAIRSDERKGKYYLYFLKDPVTKEIRYVGVTNNPERRRECHLWNNAAHLKHSHEMYYWYRATRKNNMFPVFEMVQEYSSYKEAHEMEIILIQKMGSILLNRQHNLTRLGDNTNHNCKKCKADTVHKNGIGYRSGVGYQCYICRNCGHRWRIMLFEPVT